MSDKGLCMNINACHALDTDRESNNHNKTKTKRAYEEQTGTLAPVVVNVAYLVEKEGVKIEEGIDVVWLRASSTELLGSRFRKTISGT